MTQERRNLAKNIKEFRALKGLNQTEFSEDCGMNKDTLGRIERTQENVTLDTLHALASGMDCTVVELLSPEALYILIPSDFEKEDGSTVTTYGIAAIKGYEIIEYYQNLTTDYQKAKRMITLCNNEELELCHLCDIAEDLSS